jgi:hypothetical protein
MLALEDSLSETVHVAEDAPQWRIDPCILTCALIFNAALALALELGADLIQQLVQSLAGGADGRHHAARRVAVVHGGVGLGETMHGRAGLAGGEGGRWWQSRSADAAMLRCGVVRCCVVSCRVGR